MYFFRRKVPRIPEKAKERIYKLLSRWHLYGDPEPLDKISKIYRRFRDYEMADFYQELYQKYSSP